MERFCHKCGSLVSGTGSFCPLCGEAMDVDIGSVNLSKPEVPNDVMPQGSIANDVMPQAIPSAVPAAVSAPTDAPYGGTMPMSDAAPMGSTNTYSQQPAGYSQPTPYQPVVYNNINTTPQGKHMTTGQWVLTTFLANLGIIGIILLFVWGFGDNEYPDKKNFSRAMLIWTAIGVGVYIIFLIFWIAVIGIGASEIFGSSTYY